MFLVKGKTQRLLSDFIVLKPSLLLNLFIVFIMYFLFYLHWVLFLINFMEILKNDLV